MPNEIRLILIPLLVFGAAWAIAWQCCAWARVLGLRWQVMDIPGERSSHDSPIPRLGGPGLATALVGVFAGVWLGLGPIHAFHGLAHDPLPIRLGLLFIGLVLGGLVVGLVDDFKPLHPLVKLLGQAAVATLPAWLGAGIPQITLPAIGQVAFAPPLAIALACVWVLMLLNVINFIDGINGLAARTLLWVGVAIAMCGLNRPWSIEITMVGALLAGAALGFHAWNATPARLFLGDGGSHAAGGAIAGATLLLVNNDLRYPDTMFDHDSFLGPLLMLALPLFDVGFTLVRRLLAGHSPMVPHREHLYQRLMIAHGGDHDRALAACETVLFTGALAGAYVVRFAHGGGDFTPSLAMAIAVVAGALGIYYWRVVDAERRARATPLPA